MRDYLEAPIPFIIGVHSKLADFKYLEMNQYTIIDLDTGTCVPEPLSIHDDAKVN